MGAPDGGHCGGRTEGREGPEVAAGHDIVPVHSLTSDLQDAAFSSPDGLRNLAFRIKMNELTAAEGSKFLPNSAYDGFRIIPG